MPAGADGTAKGRAVIARRVDAVYLVERHGTFVRHGARARACCNDAPLKCRLITRVAKSARDEFAHTSTLLVWRRFC